MNRLVLSQLHARCLHGFRSGDRCILAGLGAGLNIVFAPNRSGKSTLALAYRLVIGDDLRKYRSAVISASWKDGATDKEANVALGLSHDAPVPAALPMRYVLDLPEMVGGLSSKDKEATAQAIAGNVRIPDDRSVNKGLRAGLDSLREANQKLQKIENEARSLEGKRERVKELDCSIAQASTAGSDARWMHVAQFQEQLSRIDAENPGVERQSENADTRLDELLRDLGKEEENVETANSNLDSVAPSPGQRVPRLLRESDRFSIAHLLTKHEEEHAAHAHLTMEFDGIKGSLEIANQQLATGVEPDEVVPSAARFADQADRARTAQCERHAYLKASEAAIGQQEKERADQGDPKSPQRARQALLNLLTATAMRTAPSVSVMVLLGLGATAALLAAFAAFISAVAVLILGGISAMLVVIGLVFLRIAPVKAPAKSEAGGPDEPESLLDEWTDLVQKHEQSSASERAWNFVRAWFQGKTDDSPSTDETDFDATWKNWRVAAGLGEDATPYQLAMLFERWQNVRKLRLEAGSLESQVHGRRKTAAAVEAELRTILERYNWACCPGSNLADEVKSFCNWFDHSKALAEAEGRRDTFQLRIKEHLDGNGVPEGELLPRSSMLRDRASVAADRRDLSNRLKGELHVLDLSCVDADRIRTATERWRKGGTIDLPTAIERANAASTTLVDLRKDLNELKTEIRLFEEGKQVEETRSKYDRSIADLMKDCETAQTNSVWNTLVNSVREHVILESAPELLAVANAKLERVDAELVLRIAPPELDPSKEELGLLLIDDLKNRRSGQRFSELATSTKVNAVLAIRLALIEKSEQGIAYPIFADELMAVADENTRKGIARLLVAESAERQVVVMTNQAEDAQALLDEAGANATTLTIGDSAPVLPREVSVSPLPAYRVPLGPVEPDLERDVAAHAPDFLLVEESDLSVVGDSPTIAVALEKLNDERKAALEPMLAALEEIHRVVATTARRIQSTDIEKQEWFTKAKAFQDETFKILEETAGDPEDFYQRVTALKGYRDNNKNALNQFLTENEFLGVPKPRFEDLVRRARAVLGDMPDATRAAQWCALRYLSFCEAK